MITVGEDPRGALPLSSDIRPVVSLPRKGPPGVVIAFVFGVLALLLFISLDSRRRALTQAERQRPAMRAFNAFQPAPPLVVPPARLPAQMAVESAPAAPPPNLPKAAPPPPVYQRPSDAPLLRVAPVAPVQQNTASESSPVMVIDLTMGDLGAGSSANSDGVGGAGGSAGAASDDAAVRATIIRNRSSLIAQGTLIAAVLETPIDSTRPGLARALVSRDARGFDGTRVIIPRGSRLIGEYRSDVSPGQKRILVTWTRLIRPDGVAIRIGSPAADALGGSGIAGRVNTHFLARFTNAVLQSALTAGVNLASQPRSGSVYVGIPGQAATAGQSLIPNVNPNPTIKVKQGAEIAIFVARDLDFGGTVPRE